jgi:pimeloyl-ACP methyl ester carboxylesterase
VGASPRSEFWEKALGSTIRRDTIELPCQAPRCYADDLAAIIEALDLRNATLIGHSTGGGAGGAVVGSREK